MKQRKMSIVSAIALLVSTMSILSASPNIAKPVDTGANGFPPGWIDDYRITTSGYSVFPTEVVNGSNLHIAWVNQTSPYGIYYRHSEDSGKTWTKEIRLDNSGSELPGNPQIGLNASTIHIVWNQFLSPGLETFYTKSLDNGRTWTVPVQLSEGNNSYSYKPYLSVENDNVYVIWMDDRDGQYEIYFKNSSDAGETWSIDKRLTSYVLGTDSSESIAVNGTQIHITFARYVGNWETFYMNSTDGGQNWNNPVMISPGDGANSGVSDIAVNGSQVHIVWDDRRHLDGGEIYYRNSTNNGLTWNDEVRLTNNDNGSWNPSVNIEGDEVHVAFHDDRNKPAVGGDIFYLNSTDGGATWNPLVQLTSEPHPVNSAGPKIAVESSTIHIIFQDNRTGKKEIYYKRYPDFPADTIPPTIIHTSITGTPIGQTINITAEVSDNVALSGVWLNYTGVNGTNYNVSMSGWDEHLVMVSGLGPTLYAQNGNYSFEIPAQDNAGVLSYYIWSEDVYGNGAKAPADGTILIGIPAQTNLTLKHGWNLISFPVLQPKLNGTPIIRASDIVNVTGSVEIAIWNATDQNYSYYLPVIHDPWDPENFLIDEDDAIFIWMDDNATYLIEGYEPGSRNVSLKTGWNMIAYKGLAVGDVATLWADQVSAGAYDDICWYNGQTFKHYIYPGTEMELVPTRGYFVWSDSDTNLIY